MSTWQNTLREKRQEAILEAAAQVIARKGYQRATVKEIADAAGIAPGTIYLYFEDKRDLLLSIAEQVVDLMPKEVPTQATPAQVKTFIQSVLMQQLQLVEAYRPFYQALIAEAWTNETLRSQYVGRVVNPILCLINSFLRSGIEAGEVRPLDTQIVSSAILGTIALFAMTTEIPAEGELHSPDVEHIVQELTDFLLYGLKQLPGDEMTTRKGG